MYEMESEDYRECRVRIVLDEDGYASNPREWCNLSRLVFAEHRRYTMPNEVNFNFGAYDDPADCPTCDGTGEVIDAAGDDVDCPTCDGTGQVERTETFGEWCERTLTEDYGALYVVPVSMTDHSGTTYYVGRPRDPWDSGQAGYAIVTRESVAECGTAPEHFAEAVAAEVETYGAWANGEVYGWIAEDPSGETIESCWGYVGSDQFDYMKDEARTAIDSFHEERDEAYEAIAADAAARLEKVRG